MNKKFKMRKPGGNSMLARLMSRSFVRFSLAIFTGFIVSLILIVFMKSMISEYDNRTEDTLVRIMSLKTVVVNENDIAALPESEKEMPPPESISEASSVTDTQSKELTEMLRKKKELISILESSEE